MLAPPSCHRRWGFWFAASSVGAACESMLSVFG
nr:MAG TPA: hypothetical protein [Caudoviricetes sp.]